MRTTLIAPVLALVLGAAPLFHIDASAAAPAAKEAKVPAPMPEAAERLRTELFRALRPELHGPLLAVVGDTSSRLRADDQLDVRAAARDAVLAADFAGVSKRKQVIVEVVVDLVVLQVAASSHAALRDSMGRQQAFRAARACAGDSACVDGIAPTETMTAANIQYVQSTIAQGAMESATAEKLAAEETKTSTRVYGRTTTPTATIKKSAQDTMNAIISKL